MIRAAVLALAFLVGSAGAVAARPVVAILADPSGAETTDLIAPYAILAESGAVDVKVISTTAEPVRLMPGMAWIKPQMTVAAFDAAYPNPDVIIVPLLMRQRDPERSSWLRTKAARGARLMSICDGAMMLAEAGVLDGRSATIHWASVGKMRKAYPKTNWRQNARWITDGAVTTTAGVSASVPASLALLADLAGEATMRATAQRLHLPPPTPRHDGTAFRVTRAAVGTGLVSKASFWRHETIAAPIAAGVDELAVAFALDGWSRTWRSAAWVVSDGPVVSQRGLVLMGAHRQPRRFDRRLAVATGLTPEQVLADIERAYGGPSARFVALQLEQPWPQPPAAAARQLGHMAAAN